MKFMLFEDFNLSQVPSKFWKDLDFVASDIVEKKGNFYSY